MYDEDEGDDEVVQWRELQYTDCLPFDNVVSVAQIKDVLVVFCSCCFSCKAHVCSVHSLKRRQVCAVHSTLV